MSVKRNPYVGMHPDLFPRKLQYPEEMTTSEEAEATRRAIRIPESKKLHDLSEAEVARMAAWGRGETPMYVPLESLTQEQIRELPRLAFSDDEWDELDEDDRKWIEENDQDSIKRVGDLVNLLVGRYEAEMERAAEGVEHYVEYFHQVLSEETRLERWLPGRRLRDLHNYGLDEGLDEDEVNALVQQVMEDTTNYEAEVDGQGDSVWSTEIEMQVYLDSQEIAPVVEGMTKDEIERALKQTYKDTNRDLDLTAHDLRPNRDIERTIETSMELRMIVDWVNITNQVAALIDGEVENRERDDRSREAVLPDIAAPPRPRPVQPIAFKWDDGFYVADLIDDDTPVYPAEAAGILGVPIKQKDAKKGGTSLEKMIEDGRLELIDGDKDDPTFERGRVAMALESQDMGHCVGDANMGYMDGVRDGEIKIMSIRRPSSKPLFTIEAETSDGVIVKLEQIKGKGNRLPGFDRGQHQGIYGVNKDAMKATVAALKKDEVQRVVEFLADKPGHWDGRYLDIVDLQPALFAVAELVRSKDPWALKLIEQHPDLLGDNRALHEQTIRALASAAWHRDERPNLAPTKSDAESDIRAENFKARESLNATVIEAIDALGLEFAAQIYRAAWMDYVHAMPTWEIITKGGVTWVVRARTEEEAVLLAGQRHGYRLLDDDVAGTRRLTPEEAATRPTENPASSCGDHGVCEGFCRPYRGRARANPPRRTFKFEGTQEILEAIEEAEPSYEYVSPPNRSQWRPRDLHQAGQVTWLGTKGYLVEIPVENILFMEGNQWYPGHAKALLDGILDESNHVLQAPAGRVYRVTAREVKMSQKYDKDNELSYQLGMAEPWTKAEMGEYYAQLIDGNHRAAAAILAGDRSIFVYVTENSRENVYKKDLV